MTGVTLLQTLCLLVMIAQSMTSPLYSHNIYIDPATEKDTEECHTSNSSSVPCKTLDHALDYQNSSTCYILSSNATHKLTKPTAIFENLNLLAIVSEEGTATVVCGSEGIGLAFVNVSDITFANVTFLHCSAERNSTSKNFNATDFTLYTFNVGLYFYLCADVSMTGVTVSSSPNATGVVMYDTVGRNSIQDSLFTNNSVPESVPGGGGFYVEFSFCVPGDNNCNDKDNKTTNHDAVYTFTGCNFTLNTATNSEGSSDDSTYIVPYRSNHQAFGRGGGLSVFVKGTASGNLLEITNCLFADNSAQWGGGLFVEFHDETSKNSVYVRDCVFQHNICNYTLDSGTGGGGMRLGHYVYNLFQDTNYLGNRIEVLYSNFTSNWAMYGGGLSISPTLQFTRNQFEAVTIKLVHLNFTENTGKIGAALHIGLFQIITEGVTSVITIFNCTFIANSAQYTRLLKESQRYTPHTMGIGAVYINQVPTDFQGLTRFRKNVGTALVVAGSRIDFSHQSRTSFVGNTGYRGGALALLGSTYIRVEKDTKLFFWNNTASDRGGAIYNKYIEMDNLMTHSNCFVRHKLPFLKPDDWSVYFQFIGNKDSNRNHNNAIHTSSVLPCAWAGGSGNIVEKDRIFCWDGWVYRNSSNFHIVDCSSQITSEAGRITQGELDPVVPGKPFKLPLNISDDFGNDLVKEVVFSSTSNQTGSKSNYFWGGDATITGQGDRNVRLQFRSLGDRIWHVNLTARLLECPPGLKPSSQTLDNSCNCSNIFGGAISCNQKTQEVKINDGNWIGKFKGTKSSNKYLVGSCPPSFCVVTRNSYVVLPSTSDELSGVICSNHREGVVCGRCVDGYGPAVNSMSYECVNCTDINLGANVAKYLAAVYLPLAVLFTVLILFDVRLTTGPANAFILYSQVVSSTLSPDADGWIPLNRHIISKSTMDSLQRSYKVIYGVFNLEFLENLLSPFCLNRDFSTLTVLSLDYGVAIFPLVMIIVVVVCLRVRERLPYAVRAIRCRLPERLKCLSPKRSLNEALLPAFAAFLLLSYTKFSLTASYITDNQHLIDEDGNPRGPPVVYYASQFNTTTPHYQVTYLLPSILVFSTFVWITPLLLLSYPVWCLEWCVSKVSLLRKIYPADRVHILLDTFQGCFRKGMRFFAGLYFLFRLVFNVTYVMADTYLKQFVIQQITCIVMVILVAICRPYGKEKRLFNYVDVLIFANLALVNSLTFYLYTASQNGKAPPLSAFVFQYILIFLPLLYMLAYMVWYALTCYDASLKKYLLCCFDSDPYDYVGLTRSEVAVDETSEVPDDADEALFNRAQGTNHYRRANPLGPHGPDAQRAGMKMRDPPPRLLGSTNSRAEDKARNTNLSMHSSHHSQARATGSNGYGSMSSTITTNNTTGRSAVSTAGHTSSSSGTGAVVTHLSLAEGPGQPERAASGTAADPTSTAGTAPPRTEQGGEKQS